MRLSDKSHYDQFARTHTQKKNEAWQPRVPARRESFDNKFIIICYLITVVCCVLDATTSSSVGRRRNTSHAHIQPLFYADSQARGNRLDAIERGYAGDVAAIFLLLSRC